MHQPQPVQVKMPETFTEELKAETKGRNHKMLAALQGKHVYAGTVPPVTVQERRAKNKRARAARRKNRNK